MTESGRLKLYIRDREVTLVAVCKRDSANVRSYEASRLRSFVALLLVAEGFHRIDVHGAAGG